MTIEYIDIGAQPNDGSGDPIRVAFQKINNNFANVANGSGGNGGVPGGNTTEIQYNNEGVFAGSDRLTFNSTTNTLSATNIAGSGANITNINALNIVGVVRFANVSNIANYTVAATYANIANSVAGGNVTGIVANAAFAQNAGRANVANIVLAIDGANVVGQVANALVAGTVYSNNQPNITGVGVLNELNVSGNALVTGNLNVSGTTNYTNTQDLYISDPIIQQGGGANGQPLIINDGKDRGQLLYYFTTQPVSAFMGWDNSNAEFAFGSNVTNFNDVITFNQLGNVRASRFIGNLQGAASSANSIALANVVGIGNIAPINLNGNSGLALLGNGAWGSPAFATRSNIANVANVANAVAGSNVSGQVANALVAGTVYANEQPNITSVGTLTSLQVNTTANIGGNLNVSGTINGNIYGKVKVPFAFDSVSPVAIAAIPAGSTVTSISVFINTPFNSTATISVGTSSNNSQLMAATDSKLQSVASYGVFPNTKYTVQTNTNLYINPGTSTAGSGLLILNFE